MTNPFGSAQKFAFSTPIAVGTGTTALVASPGAGRKLVVQHLDILITTAAAQTFTIGGGTVTLFSAPVSLAAGRYTVDAGDLGVALPAATALSYTATAGVGLTVAGYGYIWEA